MTRAHRYLFRARPFGAKSLEDVAVSTAGGVVLENWPYLHPPLPPFVLDPLRGRFVGFHAGAVGIGCGLCWLFVGARGAGKTTACLMMVNKFGCELLTDETVFVHRRTLLVEPFPRMVKVRHGGFGGASDRACSRVANAPAAIQRIFFLNPDSSAHDASLGALTQDQVFRRLLSHHLDVGADADEAMVSVAIVARSVESYELTYQNYETLIGILRDIGSLSRNVSVTEG